MDRVRISCNFLDHCKIKMIRKTPEGNTLVLLWLLMLAEAGKCDRSGSLMVSDSLPYTAETLSMVTDIALSTVRLGLVIFSGLEMIEQQGGTICIKNWKKYQGEIGQEARPDKNNAGAPPIERRKAANKTEEEEQAVEEKQQQAKDAFWSSLSDVDRESFRAKAMASVMPGFKWPAVAVTALAKTLAWESWTQMNTKGHSSPP